MEHNNLLKQIIIPTNEWFLTSLVIETLQNSNPITSKEIKLLIQRFYGADRIKGFVTIRKVNTILTEYLADWVEQDKDGKWALTESATALVAKKPMLLKQKIIHEKPHILFVCGKNKWRSPTAERIYKKDERIEVRSAGMSGKSKHPISNNDIEWADLILVMENGYKTRILALFRDLSLPKIENLDIPDEYEYMDDELIELIKNRVEFHIEELDK